MRPRDYPRRQRVSAAGVFRDPPTWQQDGGFRFITGCEVEMNTQDWEDQSDRAPQRQSPREIRKRRSSKRRGVWRFL